MGAKPRDAFAGNGASAMRCGHKPHRLSSASFGEKWRSRFHGMHSGLRHKLANMSCVVRVALNGLSVFYFIVWTVKQRHACGGITRRGG
ncbi:hypothetical protein B0G77_2206 [Paraburkholderia sp. BL10I2N1]|nr:hypothetical protein B0G77_2206 [Paraburkholderia sp. BL10I2N1]